jgi:5-methylcytosine-specific restriction endonuclease McrA
VSWPISKCERLCQLRIERDPERPDIRRWLALAEDNTPYAAAEHPFSDEQARKILVGRVLSLRNAEAMERAGWSCERCGSTRNLSAHHNVFRSHGGNHSLENRTILCLGCHRLAHLLKA